jgi:sporulation protein YlmC with PRC-barrel domain
MRLFYKLSMVSLMLGLALPMGVFAAETENHGPAAQSSALTPQVARATDMMGLAVYNSNDKKLGKIENLAIDPSSGKIRYAVLSFGGWLGMGGKYFAVPWSALKLVTRGSTSAHTIKEDHYVLDISEQALKNAPGFDKKSWPDFGNAAWTSQIEHFYGTNKAQRENTTTR